MNANWNTYFIDPQNLITISRGNREMIIKYLRQFQDLVPQRTASLKESLQMEDRKQIRQLLHQMSPQLQFFNIPDVLVPIRRLELEFETMPMEELKSMVEAILIKLAGACKEVNAILEEQSE